MCGLSFCTSPSVDGCGRCFFHYCGRSVSSIVRSAYIFSHKWKGKRDGKGYTSAKKIYLSFFYAQIYNPRGKSSKYVCHIHLEYTEKYIESKFKIAYSSLTQIQPLLIFWYISVYFFIHNTYTIVLLHKII